MAPLSAKNASHRPTAHKLCCALVHTLGQLLHRHTRPGRLVREVLLVNAVHLREVIHGRQERSHLPQLSATNGKPNVCLGALKTLHRHEGRLMAVQKRPSYLDNPADRASGILEDVLEILAYSCSLVGDAALDQVPARVGGQLA
jgi:hypothetical protein